MYELPQPGRRIGPALVALIVVLTAAAGTVGYLGARQVMTADRGGQGDLGQQPGPGQSATGGPGQPATTPGQPATPGQPPAQPPDDSCPQLTQAAVQAQGLPGSLQLVLHIEANRRGAANAEVWICRNSAGTLFYQGWVKSGPFTAATSDHTLLLGEGVRGTVVQDAGRFVATNPGSSTRTVYVVTRQQLTQQTLPDGSLIVYQVVDVTAP